MARIAALLVVIGANACRWRRLRPSSAIFQRFAAAAAGRRPQRRFPAQPPPVQYPAGSNTRRSNSIRPPQQYPASNTRHSGKLHPHRLLWRADRRASRRSRCRRLPAHRQSPPMPIAVARPPLRRRRAPRDPPRRPIRHAATGRYGAAATSPGRTISSVTETPTAKDRERPRGVCRPRQNHRPHHLVRCGDRRNRAIRRTAGHRAGLLHATADRGDQYRCLRRGRRSDAAGRDQAHLHRLDVRFEPGSACRRASDLRCLADRLRAAADGPGGGIDADAAAARHSRPRGRARARRRCSAQHPVQPSRRPAKPPAKMPAPVTDD